jgi:copper ion binding protein
MLVMKGARLRCARLEQTQETRLMETLLDVTGMTCMNCVAHVEKALKAIDGVTGVDVDLQAGTAAVRHDARVSVASLVAAVEDDGYEAKARA